MKIRFKSTGTGWLHTNVCCLSGQSTRSIFIFRSGQELEIANLTHHVDGPGMTKRARLMAPCSFHLGVQMASDYIEGIPRAFFEVVEEPAE